MEFHSSLLDIVEARLASYTALTEFGDLFVEKVRPIITLLSHMASDTLSQFDETFVTMYKRYVRDFDSTHLVIKFLEGAKPEFRVHIDVRPSPSFTLSLLAPLPSVGRSPWSGPAVFLTPSSSLATASS